MPCMFISPGSNGVVDLLQCCLLSGRVPYLVIYVLCMYMRMLLHAHIYRQSSLGEVLIGMNFSYHPLKNTSPPTIQFKFQIIPVC